VCLHPTVGIGLRELDPGRLQVVIDLLEVAEDVAAIRIPKRPILQHRENLQHDVLMDILLLCDVHQDVEEVLIVHLRGQWQLAVLHCQVYEFQGKH
jgi:hypothetical protein